MERVVAHRVRVERRTVKVNEVISTARDSLTVKRVYGDPYEKDGLTVIPRRLRVRRRWRRHRP